LTSAVLAPATFEAIVAHPAAGAVCTFSGVVRAEGEGRVVEALEYEAFPEMALPAMEALRAEAEARWPGTRVALAHRVGRLAIGEVSVVVTVSHGHRDAAFAACRYVIDALKATVPIWKKEIWSGGEAWTAGTAPAPLHTAAHPPLEDS
jgi:molybdopterin synthase catalytic subunit